MKPLPTIVLSFSLVLSFSFAAAAQNTTIVKGTLVEKASGQPDAFSTVQFLSVEQGEKVVAYALSGEDGSFEQSLHHPGNYILLYSNISRKECRIPFTLTDQRVYDFGTVEVEDDVEVLRGATVISQRNLVKMEVDRMTYLVESDADARTSTVLEMLRKVPMVSVDGQDNITVNGSSSFQVYVDGKPNQMLSANPSQMFKAMSANSVKSIEVITNPGVRYDAEGAGGVLNITTVSGNAGSVLSDGYYGTLTANATNRGLMGSGSLNVQKGKLSLGLTAQGMSMTNKGMETSTERIQHTDAGDVTTNTLTATTLKVPSYMLNANANYVIDDQNVVSLTGGVMHFGMNTDGTTATSILPLGLSYDGTTSVHGGSNSITASADYQHTWADVPGRSYTLSYQFSGAPRVNNTLNTFGGSQTATFDLTDRKSDGRSNSVSHIVQADFVTPFGAKGTFSTGAKYQLRDNSSDQTNYFWDGASFLPTEAGSLKYQFRNRIAAVYAEYAGNYGPLGIKGGVRYEHTWQDVRYLVGLGDDFRLRYGNLVPAASVQWNINQAMNLGISYNLRISRPGITFLNPYVDTTDPTALTYGNTDLKTENTHNISLVYNLNTRKVVTSLTLRHSLTPNGISQYSFFDGDGLLNTTYGNVVRNNTTGLNGYVMLMLWDATRIYLNGSLNYTDLRSEALEAAHTAWTHSLTLGLQQTLPWDIRLSANLIATGNSIGIQNVNTGMNMLTLGLSRSFFENRLTLSASAIGTIDSGIYIKRSSTTTGPDFTSVTKEKIPMGTVTLGLTWNFGGQGRSASRKAQHKSLEDNQLDNTSIGESMSRMMMH